jgi:hypothetical protein
MFYLNNNISLQSSNEMQFIPWVTALHLSTVMKSNPTQARIIVLVAEAEYAHHVS